MSFDPTGLPFRPDIYLERHLTELHHKTQSQGVCVCVCVSHQVGPSSPVEEESIWVNLQGDQCGGPAVRLLDKKRYGGIRDGHNDSFLCGVESVWGREESRRTHVDVCSDGRGSRVTHSSLSPVKVMFTKERSCEINLSLIFPPDKLGSNLPHCSCLQT